MFVGAGVLVWLGYIWARDDYRVERADLVTQRQVLEAEWRALDGTEQVRAVFLAASRAMQDEARRHEKDGPRD
jgi:hypothetical protein